MNFLILSPFFIAIPALDQAATKGMVFMLCGINPKNRWKKIVAYHYTMDSFCAKTVADLVKTIIGRSQGIGYNVVGLPNDMGAGNVAF